MHINLGSRATKNISKIHNINGWQNRAVYGAAALISQPFFDRFNPNVDKKTQKVSMTKTIIKICVGACVGITARSIFQKWGENLVKKGLFKSKYFYEKNIFKPVKVAKNKIPKESYAKLPERDYFGSTKEKNRYKESVGNVFAIIGAISTMFTVDALIMDKFLSHYNKKFKKIEEESKKEAFQNTSFGKENAEIFKEFTSKSRRPSS